MDHFLDLTVQHGEARTSLDPEVDHLSALVHDEVEQRGSFDAPQARTDTEAALNAATVVLNKNAGIKHWVAFGLNDEAVLGAVRAAEGVGIGADGMIGVGIGGADSAINEFKKPEPTGFYGTVIISPKRHGYETALNMYEWIADGKEPEKLILTSGALALRDNYQDVRKDLGIE